MKVLKSRYLFFILLSISLVAQLPFLGADPDAGISYSRGPFSDEGLYTSNIRNFINHHNYDFDTSDVPIKSPLFSLLFYFPFLILGTHLFIARLTILALSFLLFLWAIRQDKSLYLLGITMLLLLFFEYHFFHFLHFALADGLIPILIFLGISLSWHILQKNKPIIAGFISAGIVFISYLLKFQFVYLVFLFPVLFFIGQFVIKSNKELFKKAFFASVISTLLFAVIFLLFWFFPHKNEFLLILKTQSANKFVSIHHLDGNIFLLFTNLLLGKEYLITTIVFISSTIIYILFLRKNAKPIYNYFFLSSILWLLLESHKLTMTYLPTRYLIPILMPVLLIISLTLSAFYLKNKGSRNIVAKYIFYAFIGFIIFHNIFDYYGSYRGRKYEIKKINIYLAKQNISQETVMGNWASSFTWESKSRSIPIIDDTFRDSNVVEKYNPRIVILEKTDTLSPNNIFAINPNLRLSVDSIISIPFYRYNLLFYWRLTNNKLTTP